MDKYNFLLSSTNVYLIKLMDEYIFLFLSITYRGGVINKGFQPSEGWNPLFMPGDRHAII